MKDLFIQVYRHGEWRKVTTISFEDRAYDEGASRRQAIRVAFLHLADWHASDQFTGLKLRVAEQVFTRWGEPMAFRPITRIAA